MIPSSLDTDAAYHRAMDAAKDGNGPDRSDLDTLQAAGRDDLALRVEAAIEQARTTTEPFETHATVEGTTFTVRLFRMGDGWNWTVKGSESHGFGFTGSRSWANQRLALDDAVARIEDEVL